MTASAASTMSIAFHLPGGKKLDVSVNQKTGDIGMRMKEQGYDGMITVPTST